MSVYTNCCMDLCHLRVCVVTASVLCQTIYIICLHCCCDDASRFNKSWCSHAVVLTRCSSAGSVIY
jgi:hypothetical protein